MTARPQPDSEAIVRALRGKWMGDSAMCRCPAHEDRIASLHVTVAGGGKVLLKCHAGCSQRMVVEALRGLGLWPEAASRSDRAGKRAGAARREDERSDWPVIMPVPDQASEPPAPRARPGEHHEARHIYRDAGGRILLCVDRFRDPDTGAKRFCPWTFRHPPGQPKLSEWAPYGPAGELPLYGQDRLPGAEAVLLVEGERTADTAQELAPSGFAVLSFMGGAGAAGRADYRPLAHLPLTGWPDHDAAGEKAMATALARAAAAGAMARGIVAVPPGFPPRWDLADPWPETGADPAARIAELIDGAEPDGRPGDLDDAGAGELGEWDAGLDDYDVGPRRWLLGTVFCRGFLSELLAGGAVGKTALRIAQALSLATGRSLTGEHVFCRARVLFISFEDGRDELRRRVHAAMLHYKIEPADVRGWLFLATPKSLRLAEMRDGGYHSGELESILRQTIISRKIDLVIIDPFVKVHALEENSNSAIDFVCTILVGLATELDIAVDALHHVRKGASAAGDADSGRGATAFKDAGRLVYTLARMSPDEANQLGVSEAERRRLVRLDSAKVNIAPPAAAATWFKMVGVRLNNATAEYPSGDEVHTVELWSPPDMWATVNVTVANEVLNKIEAGLADGDRYSDASNAAPERSAWRVVRSAAPELTEAQCRNVIKTWLRSGVLEKREYRHAEQRKARIGLFVNAAKRPGNRDG